MAPGYFLMVFLCMAISVRGSSNVTVSTEEISWSKARDACAENGSILAGSEELRDVNISNVWTEERTFLTDWVAYQGCHIGNLSDIQGTPVTSPKVGRCQLLCKTNGSEYFILQDTNVCKCIDITTGSMLNRTHDSRCNRTCGDGPEEVTKCGGTGDHVVSLYRTSDFTDIDSTEDLCLVFKLDTNSTVILMTVPCDSGIPSAACVKYNETTEADEVKIITHNGTRDKAVRLCEDGYIPGMDNTTKAKLLEKAHTNQIIWSGYIRQRIHVNDSGINLDNRSMVQCYAMENGTHVRRNCTENRRYSCRKESVDGIPTTERVPTPEKVMTTTENDSTTKPILSTDTLGEMSTMPEQRNSSRNNTGITGVSTTQPLSTTRQQRSSIPKPRKSSREDAKIIGVAAGIAGGCIVLVMVTAFVANRLCKRSARKKKRHKKKKQHVKLNEIIRKSDPPEGSIHSDSSVDESDHETNFTAAAGNLPNGGGRVSATTTVKYNYDTVNKTATDNGHVNDAYAYAETTSNGSAEGDYDAMELCLNVSDDDGDHIYSHTMLPLPSDHVTEEVSKEQDIGDAYDVMQAKVNGKGNGTTYDHTDIRSAINGTPFNGGYDVFNGKVNVDVADTYDHAESVQSKNADLRNSEYDAFNGKVKGDEYSDTDMYDHANIRSTSLGKHTDDADNVYDSCNATSNNSADIDDVYDHAIILTRENQDENLYDLTSKRKDTPSVDEDPYDHL